MKNRIIRGIVVFLGLFLILICLASLSSDIEAAEGVPMATPVVEANDGPSDCGDRQIADPQDQPNCGSIAPPDGGNEEQLNEDDGGHQPWRIGPRGRCPDHLDGQRCQYWQQGVVFADADGDCPAGLEYIPAYQTLIGLGHCGVSTAADQETQQPEAEVSNSVAATASIAPQSVRAGGGSPLETPSESPVEGIVALPNTGHGTSQPPDNSSITPTQRLVVLVVVVIIGVFIARLAPWRSAERDDQSTSDRSWNL